MIKEEKLRDEGIQDGMLKGLLIGLEFGLDFKLGKSGSELMNQIKDVSKNEKYEMISCEEILNIVEKLRYEVMHIEILKGIELGLDIKFGRLGLKLMNRIKDVSNIEKLEEIKNLLRKAKKIEEIEKKLMN